jgi:hypothetical protein
MTIESGGTMKPPAAFALAALLTTVPQLAASAAGSSANLPSGACKKVLADERAMTTRIRNDRRDATNAQDVANEANRAIHDLGNNPQMAAAIASIKADRAKQLQLAAAARARARNDEAALKQLQEQALRVCPKRTSK